MTDLVERLRTYYPVSAQDLVEAADEIERLRKALDEMEEDQHQSNNLQWREIERLKAFHDKAILEAIGERLTLQAARKEIERLREVLAIISGDERIPPWVRQIAALKEKP